MPNGDKQKPFPETIFRDSRLLDSRHKMSHFRNTIQNIQRAVGVEADGVFGPITAEAVIRELYNDTGRKLQPLTEAALQYVGLDERSISNIETLDEKVRPAFAQFTRLAKATAATLGCEFVMISGNRSWEEQNEIYAQGRTKPGKRVTNAKGGFSNHNFKIAGDFGVFKGKVYMDASAPAVAARVHQACSEHALSCGLIWGGDWQDLADYPHYEFHTGMSMAEKRKKFKAEGTVL